MLPNTLTRTLPRLTSARPVQFRRQQCTFTTPAPTSKLEVERKFPSAHLWALSENDIDLFSKSIGSKLSERRIITDLYWDTKDDRGRLMDKGVYIRERSTTDKIPTASDYSRKIPATSGQLPTPPGETTWEIKIRQSGDYINTSCLELTGYENVTTLLQRYNLRIADLKHVARITTDRKTYAVGAFRIVLDRSHLDFVYECVDGMQSRFFKFHHVGEVELCEDVEAGKEKEVGGAMDERIRGFMRGRGVFEQGGVESKLTAYFRWDASLRKMLGEAGLLDVGDGGVWVGEDGESRRGG